MRAGGATQPCGMGRRHLVRGQQVGERQRQGGQGGRTLAPPLRAHTRAQVALPRIPSATRHGVPQATGSNRAGKVQPQSRECRQSKVPPIPREELMDMAPTFVGSLPEKAPPPCAPHPPYVSMMILRPARASQWTTVSHAHSKTTSRATRTPPPSAHGCGGTAARAPRSPPLSSLQALGSQRALSALRAPCEACACAPHAAWHAAPTTTHHNPSPTLPLTPTLPPSPHSPLKPPPVRPASPWGPPITKRPEGLRWKMVLSSRYLAGTMGLMTCSIRS